MEAPPSDRVSFHSSGRSRSGSRPGFPEHRLSQLSPFCAGLGVLVDIGRSRLKALSAELVAAEGLFLALLIELGDLGG